MAQPNPVRKIRAGTISCALWRNEVNVAGRTVTLLKASVERRFRDSDGVWKSSGSFSRNEIPLVIYCLTQAFDAMVKQDNAEETSEPGSSAL